MKIQTFLPYPDFELSASVLDRMRLGKQRAECIQLLRALDDSTDRIHRHPACIMWFGHKDALVAYGLVICDEWSGRGYEDNSYGKILAFKTCEGIPTQATVSLPRWFGNPMFHASHRANLLKKDHRWYSNFGWTESPLMPYVWPK